MGLICLIELFPPVAKMGMGNPFYKASNGGCLEGYGKRRVSPKVNSAGKRNERGVTGKGSPRILSEQLVHARIIRIDAPSGFIHMAVA